MSSSSTSLQNELCPIMPHLTLLIASSLSLITILLMYLFWKNKETPAFKSRRPIMTLAISICIILANLLFIFPAYTICDYGKTHQTLYFNILSAAIYTFALWLITYRTWVLFINWKMAICQLDAEEAGIPYMARIPRNIWYTTMRKCFVSKSATYCWCVVLLTFVIIEMIVADTSVYFHLDPISLWTIRCGLFLWMFISLILVITARNMRDHFSIMLEMKIYILFEVFIVTIFICVGEFLPIWAPQNNPAQIAQINIFINVIQCGISALLFIGFPVFRFRSKFHGILIDQNLFEEAFIGTASETPASKSVASISFNIRDRSLMDPVVSVKICNKMYPTLYTFLSTKKKCYDVFTKHLVSCLAVENLLFFTEAQAFRLRVKLAIQAKIDSLSSVKEPDQLSLSYNTYAFGNVGRNNEESDEMIQLIMKLDFFYLHSSGGMSFFQDSIKDNWLKIYNKYIAENSTLQINLSHLNFEALQEFNDKILSEDSDVSVHEYVKIYETAMLEIWWLMKTLYLHFQISNEYEAIVKTHFPIYQKYNNTLQQNNEAVHDHVMDTA